MTVFKDSHHFGRPIAFQNPNFTFDFFRKSKSKRFINFSAKRVDFG